MASRPTETPVEHGRDRGAPAHPRSAVASRAQLGDVRGSPPQRGPPMAPTTRPLAESAARQGWTAPSRRRLRGRARLIERSEQPPLLAAGDRVAPPRAHLQRCTRRRRRRRRSSAPALLILRARQPPHGQPRGGWPTKASVSRSARSRRDAGSPAYARAVHRAARPDERRMLPASARLPARSSAENAERRSASSRRCRQPRRFTARANPVRHAEPRCIAVVAPCRRDERERVLAIEAAPSFFFAVASSGVIGSEHVTGRRPQSTDDAREAAPTIPTVSDAEPTDATSESRRLEPSVGVLAGVAPRGRGRADRGHDGDRLLGTSPPALARRGVGRGACRRAVLAERRAELSFFAREPLGRKPIARRCRAGWILVDREKGGIAAAEIVADGDAATSGSVPAPTCTGRSPGGDEGEGHRDAAVRGSLVAEADRSASAWPEAASQSMTPRHRRPMSVGDVRNIRLPTPSAGRRCVSIDGHERRARLRRRRAAAAARSAGRRSSALARA